MFWKYLSFSILLCIGTIIFTLFSYMLGYNNIFVNGYFNTINSFSNDKNSVSHLMTMILVYGASWLFLIKVFAKRKFKERLFSKGFEYLKLKDDSEWWLGKSEGWLITGVYYIILLIIVNFDILNFLEFIIYLSNYVIGLYVFIDCARRFDENEIRNCIKDFRDNKARLMEFYDFSVVEKADEWMLEKINEIEQFWIIENRKEIENSFSNRIRRCWETGDWSEYSFENQFIRPYREDKKGFLILTTIISVCIVYIVSLVTGIGENWLTINIMRLMFLVIVIGYCRYLYRLVLHILGKDNSKLTRSEIKRICLAMLLLVVIIIAGFKDRVYWYVGFFYWFLWLPIMVKIKVEH